MLRSRGGDERSTIPNPSAIAARVHRLVLPFDAMDYDVNSRYCSCVMFLYALRSFRCMPKFSKPSSWRIRANVIRRSNT